jgi:NADH dehydrogenase
VEGADGVWALGDCAAVPDLAARNGAVRAPTAKHAYRQACRLAGNIVAALRGGTPRPYRHASAGSGASLGLYRGAAEVYGLRMRGFPARATHRPYHLLKLPTVNRRLRVISDWTLALLFPGEVVSLDVLEHPRQDYEAALRVLATGSHRTTPLSAREEKEDDYHAYRR